MKAAVGEVGVVLNVVEREPYPFTKLITCDVL
jgi:hypothetical protein